VCAERPKSNKRRRGTHLSTHVVSQRLDRLGLSCACRAVRVASIAEVHALSHVQVTLVRERRVDKLVFVALILESVLERRVAHAHLQKTNQKSRKTIPKMSYYYHNQRVKKTPR
jgi:hypothetical protein